MPFQKLEKFSKKVSDFTDNPSENLAPAEIKAIFDTPPEELRETLNKLIDDLTSDGSSKIGVRSVSGLNNENLQAAIESLKKLSDEKTVNTGDHRGSWQGLTPGMIGAPEMNSARITNAEDKIAISFRRVVYIENAPYYAKAGLDSTSAFVKAYSELNDYDVIIVPKGTFNIAAGLNTSKRISVIGMGKDVSILNFTHTDGTPCISYSNPLDPGISNIKLRDISIVGNANTGDGIFLKYVTDSVIDEIKVSGCGRDGIHFEKGWINDFSRITSKENKRHGVYISELPQKFSEVNAVNIWKCNILRNEKIGIVIGDETNTFSESMGYGVNIQDNHFSENGIGNIQISGARAVNINEGNYFEVVGTKISTYGGDPFHIYVGKRSGSGISVAQEVNVHGNHFNAMNDVRYGANNTTGYAIIADNVIGLNIGGNHFYQSIQGSVLVKSPAKRIWIEPNSVYESPNIQFINDQSTGQVVYWEQDKNAVKLRGDFAGNTHLNQSFENVIRNGNFKQLSTTGLPVYFTTQSLSFSKDTDGGLICNVIGGTYPKVLSVLPASIFDELKGKYITLTATVKALSTNAQNFYIFTNDGVSEEVQIIPKDDNYSTISVTRLISSNATKLELGIFNYNSSSVVGDKVYLKHMRANKGKSAVGYQRNHSDHHNEDLTHLGNFSLPNIIQASDNTDAAVKGVPVNGLYRDATGTLKIRIS